MGKDGNARPSMLIQDATQRKENNMIFLLGIPALISGIGAAFASTAATVGTVAGAGNGTFA